MRQQWKKEPTKGGGNARELSKEFRMSPVVMLDGGYTDFSSVLLSRTWHVKIQSVAWVYKTKNRPVYNTRRQNIKHSTNQPGNIILRRSILTFTGLIFIA